MDRYEQPLSQESYRKVRQIDELDAYKQQRDLELEETKELADLSKLRKPLGD